MRLRFDGRSPRDRARSAPPARPANVPHGQATGMIPSPLANAGGEPLAKDSVPVASELIISYDGTPNDDDALELGRMLRGRRILARTRVRAALARVRSPARAVGSARRRATARPRRRRTRGRPGLQARDRERLDRRRAREARGGRGRLGDRVRLRLPNPARTARAGHLGPASARGRLGRGRDCGGRASQQLARFDPHDRGAGRRARRTRSPARRPTRSPRSSAPASSTSSAGDVDLIVVGSQPGAPDGHIAIGGDVRGELDRARASVLVLPAGRPLRL